MSFRVHPGIVNDRFSRYVDRTRLARGARRAADAASIGRALATAFARRGWDVALQSGRDAPRAALEAIVAEVEALGRRATVLDADLSLETEAA